MASPLKNLRTCADHDPGRSVARDEPPRGAADLFRLRRLDTTDVTRQQRNG